LSDAIEIHTVPWDHEAVCHSSTNAVVHIYQKQRLRTQALLGKRNLQLDAEKLHLSRPAKQDY
jgi:hypothetical protein